MIHTENNEPAYELGNECLAFFSKIGGMRNSSVRVKLEYFKKAVLEDLEVAIKILFWGRDARNGAGERKTFHDIVGEFINIDFIARNAKALINLGYAKDLLPYMGNEKVLAEWAMILKGESNGVRRELVAKWTPRKGSIFKALRTRMALTNKELRTLLVSASHTVEQQMALKEWQKINYSAVPGAAMRKYGSSFQKNDADRFDSWKKDKLSKAAVSATYPHDVITTGVKKDWVLAQKLWDNLPELSGGVNPIIMADTSGSMSGLPMLVSCSLGIFCADQLRGDYNGKVMTFSENPKFHDLSEFTSLKDKWDYLNGNMDWGGSTDFAKAYQLLLDSAKFYSTPPERMPKMIICISDMQFNHATDRWKGNDERPTHEKMQDEFMHAGYVFPKLVYWNVRASYGSPASDLTMNTALISGFNPAVIKPLLNEGAFNPIKVMYESIDHINLDFSSNPLKKSL